jgi:mannose-6-phosphate isomerase
VPELVYPYLFERIAIAKPWAGKRLASVFPRLAADFPPGTGESIELADLRQASPKVANGEARGWTLQNLLAQFKREILGPWGSVELSDFPVALKFIDTQEPLSIQVHPRDGHDGAGNLVERGKTEAWLILEADENAVIWQGLKPGLTRQDFERALAGGMPQETLNARKVKRGDWLLNEAGMIHALGGGLTLLEIQQNCGVTLRFFDWPELGRRARELQVAEAFAAADFEARAPEIVRAAPGEGVQELQHPATIRVYYKDEAGVRQERMETKVAPFSAQSLRATKASRHVKEWLGFTIFTCLEGAAQLVVHGAGELHTNELRPGDTVLVPACFNDFEIYPHKSCWLIETYAV